uniref:Histamine H1 receptor n=1 Tax=Junco hyemalis TaxID=40217 RepID=A0A8C5IK46_JUNHY
QTLKPVYSLLLLSSAGLEIRNDISRVQTMTERPRPGRPLRFSLTKKMSNNTTEASSSAPRALLGLFLGSISLITIVMNILVLCAVRTEKKLQTVGNLYIVSLSIADLIVGAAVMPLNIVDLLSPRWPLGLAACLFWLSMDYVASTASIFNLFILCMDRYRSVQQPLRYLKYRTKMRASLLILGVWLLSFTWLIPILGWHIFANNGHRTVQGNKCETEFFEVTWFKVLAAIFNFYLPSLLMLWFYCRIFSTVRKHCQHRQLSNGSYWSSVEKATTPQTKTREEKNICLQEQVVGGNTPGAEKKSSPEPHKVEAELCFSHPDRASKEHPVAREQGEEAFMLCWIPYFVLFMVITFHDHKQLSELHRATICHPADFMPSEAAELSWVWNRSPRAYETWLEETPISLQLWAFVHNSPYFDPKYGSYFLQKVSADSWQICAGVHWKLPHPSRFFKRTYISYFTELI